MIVNHARHGGFFEALDQLFSQSKPDAELTSVGNKRLNLQASPSLQFPAHDVQAFFESHDAITLVCCFMGLYGVDSPLPVYFNELCLKRNETGKSARAFLDIFNHRNYVLYYLTWRAFYPDRQGGESLSTYWAVIQALSSGEQDDGADCISYCAQSTKGRLVKACQGILPSCEINIDEFVPSWIKIESYPSLGCGFMLNDNSLLGQNVYDESSKIRLRIKTDNQLIREQLLSNGRLADRLRAILKSHLQTGVSFEIILNVRQDNARFTLGQTCSNLGRDTWLGFTEGNQHVIEMQAS